MAVHVVTFADNSMRFMHRRFRSQALSFGVFENIWCLTEDDLDSDFRIRFQNELSRGVRGFGYFVWKPQVILQALTRIPDGDVLLYVDSGSHLVPTGLDRFKEYLEIVEQSDTGMLAFQLTLLERSWSKGDLLDYFGVRGVSEIVDTSQIQAGAIFVKKSDCNLRFVLEWLRVFEERFDLVDDTPSLAPDLEGFVAHRHDQSVFSLLSKLRGIALLDAEEQFPEENPNDWTQMSRFPIHHRRDKSSKCQKATLYVRHKVARAEAFLVRVKRTVIGH